ncbi:MAG: hypothetical protein ACPHW3_03140 [Candidatus Puniceispirillales bacterium]
MNRLSLRLVVIMTVIILLAEMVILIPSLSRFHHNEMLIEARRQLYLHQVAILHGNQDFANEISPKEGKPRITLTAKPARRYLPITMLKILHPCHPIRKVRVLAWPYPD